MKAIMISDKPKWCTLMMNGHKTVEVRTSKALATAIQKLIDENGYADIYVYCTKDKSDKETLKLMRGKYGCMKNYDPYGKVIFKFRCYKVEEVSIKKWNIYFENNLLKESCLHEHELFNYIGDFRKEPFYAIHISNLEIFDRPKELSEFKKPRYCDCKLRCDNNLEHSFCREVCSHNLDSERLSVCCDRDGWVKEYNIGNMYLTKAPQNFCYIESEE